MKIEHIAMWTNQLELLREFYEKYFEAKSGDKYLNPEEEFESYFLAFSDGTRLELMQIPRLASRPDVLELKQVGFSHLAFSVGSRERVDALTGQLKSDGYSVASPPRFTGDGYYESVILDPDGNRVEITI